MAYVTGVVNSLAALVTAIQSACTANGWTLSGDVLRKGSVYTKIVVNGSLIEVLGGTGIDGSNNLTGQGPALARIKTIAGVALSFPMTYHGFIHTNPDEVFFVVVYDTVRHQYIAFGQSDVLGLPGTGGWYSASVHGASGDLIWISATGNGVNNVSAGEVVPALFWRNGGSGAPLASAGESFVHHNLDGVGWSTGDDSDGNAGATKALAPLIANSPNAWNQETVLLPINAFVVRTSGNKTSLVVSVKHARYAKVNYHNPGDIITLGADEWMLFPWHLKDAASSGGGGLSHTATYGWALRYDGP